MSIAWPRASHAASPTSDTSAAMPPYLAPLVSDCGCVRTLSSASRQVAKSHGKEQEKPCEWPQQFTGTGHIRVNTALLRDRRGGASYTGCAVTTIPVTRAEKERVGVGLPALRFRRGTHRADISTRNAPPARQNAGGGSLLLLDGVVEYKEGGRGVRAQKDDDSVWFLRLLGP